MIQEKLPNLRQEQWDLMQLSFKAAFICFTPNESASPLNSSSFSARGHWHHLDQRVEKSQIPDHCPQQQQSWRQTMEILKIQLAGGYSSGWSEFNRDHSMRYWYPLVCSHIFQATTISHACAKLQRYSGCTGGYPSYPDIPFWIMRI